MADCRGAPDETRFMRREQPRLKYYGVVFEVKRRFRLLQSGGQGGRGTGRDDRQRRCGEVNVTEVSTPKRTTKEDQTPDALSVGACGSQNLFPQ